ncbi:polysaccharide deacetylase family protein [Salipaludibacillus aurantiacus]|uniref:Peptidoglycan/xylan/chitin deacetylase, PgdA/CDA1 family n=1 Tax=Salipaludibacillus aurantiacus TaxID=1601833 RepID=A0A1H9U009_9BACI|nr:polysaccharide deacetylase family protein [Salipaludibacillus aurantiacus]SES02494.1 Peptidoglycan/xylan/chitin deacetylase, PgdA/CDA1 family [Salipaludibacillus aurantiacus]
MNKRKFISAKRKGTGRKNREPVLVFTFDDAFLTDYSKAYPEMTIRGIKGTSYVATNWLNRTDREFCSWSQLKEMNDSDWWDVQCHTHTHPRLSELTESEVRSEMETVNQEFENNGLPLPKHHAYPYGDTSDLVKEVLNEYRSTQRLTGRYRSSDLNSYRSIRSDEQSIVKAISVDMQSQQDLNDAKGIVKEAYHKGSIIVLYCHEILEEDSGYEFAVLEEYFIQLLDYIVNLRIKTMTISEMYDYVFGVQ